MKIKKSATVSGVLLFPLCVGNRAIILHEGGYTHTSRVVEIHSIQPGNIRFETENRDVRELIRKLSLIFKEMYLDYLWASEDIGSNVGAVQYQDGKALIEFIPTPGTRAAVEKSLDILGARAADYGLAFNPNSGNYEYGGIESG